MSNDGWQREPVAVLLSGGPDSAVLLGEIAQTSPRVVPVYLRFGMIWDADEERAVRAFCAALKRSNIASPCVFSLPLGQVYGTHWSNTGDNVPDENSPDAAVDLPGRNLLVVLQAAVWCFMNGIPTLALGLLKTNPFPDSTPQFFAAYEQAINAGLAANLRLVRPYSTLTKVEVLQRGAAFPLELTWSCMQPRQGLHCGTCNKCSERIKAFRAANVTDRTVYFK